MITNLIFLQAAEGANAGGSMSGFIMIAAMIAIFYFFMIRPQQKKQKEIKKFREAIKKGDKVITAGGIYGRIVDVEETTFMIEIDSNVKIRIDKNSVYASPEDTQQK